MTVCETHASWVFLCGDRAYKVKKPVLFPFLDYATVERRAAMCDEEVRMNRRLAPSIYFGVRPVVRDNERLRVGEPGEGPVLDYAVLMRRFSSGDTLAAAIRSGAGASAAELTAPRLAAFHAAAPAAPVGEVAAQRVRAVLDETFATLATLARNSAHASSPPPSVSRERSSPGRPTSSQNAARRGESVTVTATCEPSTSSSGPVAASRSSTRSSSTRRCAESTWPRTSHSS